MTLRWLLVLALVGSAGTVHAQPAADRAKAAARFKQGQEYFKAGDYDRAIAEYETAFALSKEPVLIFNIGLCHDRAKRPDKALEAFQRYLELAPNGEVADEAREDVARLVPVVDDNKRKTDDARRADQAKRDKEAHDADLAAQAKRAAEATEREHHRAAVEARADPLSHRAAIERYAAIASGVACAISFGVAAKFGLDARSAANDITNHRGPWTDDALARDADGRSAQTNAIIFTTIGAATAVTAGVLYILSRRDARSAHELRLELSPTQGGAQVTFGRAF